VGTGGGPGGGFRRSGEVLKETVMAVVEAQWFLAALHLRKLLSLFLCWKRRKALSFCVGDCKSVLNRKEKRESEEERRVGFL
jgi:hypothetical protein